MTRNVTVVVPTYNRYVRLARLLKYYDSCGAPFPMLILDSSSEFSEIPGLCHSKQTIAHIRFSSSLSPIAKIVQGLEKVDTGYVVLWADDDFLVPSSIDKAIAFLEQNNDYSVAHGQSGLFLLNSRNRMDQVVPYPQASITQDTAAERLRSFLKAYFTIFYSVHRTAMLKPNMNVAQRYGFGHYWGELALACLSIIQGKAHQMPCLYMLREVHEGSGSWSEANQQTDFFDWVAGATFSRRYSEFRDCLAKAICETDALDMSVAQQIVKEAFSAYLALGLNAKLKMKETEKSTLRRLRHRVGASFPRVRSALHLTQSRMPGQAMRMSLPALLREGSPYHHVFVRIYEAISGNSD